MHFNQFQGMSQYKYFVHIVQVCCIQGSLYIVTPYFVDLPSKDLENKQNVSFYSAVKCIWPLECGCQGSLSLHHDVLDYCPCVVVVNVKAIDL